MEIKRYVGEDTIYMVRNRKIDVVELLELSDPEIDYGDGHKYRRCCPITIIIPDEIGLMTRPLRKEAKESLEKSGLTELGFLRKRLGKIK